MIRIALRFDDPSPTSDHALERELLDILGKLDIPLTAAVVPYGRNQVPIQADNVPHLVAAHAAGLLEVAQHGLHHEHLTTNSEGVNSEFQDIFGEEQARRIVAGRRMLEAVFPGPLVGFVPPWNTFDATTLDVLERNGFQYIAIDNSCYTTQLSSIRLLPRSCNVDHLEEACHLARRFSTTSIIIATLHHYDFNGSYQGGADASLRRISVEAFHGMLRRLRDMTDIEFTTMGKIAADLSNRQCLHAQTRWQLLSRAPWRLRQLFPRQQLLVFPLWRYLLARKWYAHT